MLWIYPILLPTVLPSSCCGNLSSGGGVGGGGVSGVVGISCIGGVGGFGRSQGSQLGKNLNH